MKTEPRGRRAFTLVEALLASTVLAIVAAAAALPFVAGVQNAQEAGRLEQAVELGEAMMEEVLARPFLAPGEDLAAPGPDVGDTSRDRFDNVDDFHNYAEAPNDLRNYDNQHVEDDSVQGFRREVTVQYVTFANQAPTDVDSLVHVQVRVYYGNVLLARLDRLVSRED